MNVFHLLLHVSRRVRKRLRLFPKSNWRLQGVTNFICLLPLSVIFFSFPSNTFFTLFLNILISDQLSQGSGPYNHTRFALSLNIPTSDLTPSPQCLCKCPVELNSVGFWRQQSITSLKMNIPGTVGTTWAFLSEQKSYIKFVTFAESF